MSPRSIVDDIVEDVWISILLSLSIEDLLSVRKVATVPYLFIYLLEAGTHRNLSTSIDYRLANTCTASHN